MRGLNLVHSHKSPFREPAAPGSAGHEVSLSHPCVSCAEVSCVRQKEQVTEAESRDAVGARHPLSGKARGEAREGK